MRATASVTVPCDVCRGNGTILDFTRLGDLNGPPRPRRKCPHCINGRIFKRGFGKLKRHLKSLFSA